MSTTSIPGVMGPLLLPEALGLSPVQRARLALEVLAAYRPLRRLMRTNDFHAMVALARDVGRRPAVASPDSAHVTAVRLGKIVRKVLRVLPTENRCLIRSLVLSRMLARRSIDGRIVIGVRTGEAFAAHAWVEHDGVPVLPPGRYERLYEL